MKQAYIISRGAEEFAAAREQFALIVDRLQSVAGLGMEHGEVEGLISREGTELEAVAARAPRMRAAAETREVGVRGARWGGTKPCTRRVSKASGEIWRGPNHLSRMASHDFRKAADPPKRRSYRYPITKGRVLLPGPVPLQLSQELLC